MFLVPESFLSFFQLTLEMLLIGYGPLAQGSVHLALKGPSSSRGHPKGDVTSGLSIPHRPRHELIVVVVDGVEFCRRHRHEALKRMRVLLKVPSLPTKIKEATISVGNHTTRQHTRKQINYGQYGLTDLN